MKSMRVSYESWFCCGTRKVGACRSGEEVGEMRGSIGLLFALLVFSPGVVVAAPGASEIEVAVRSGTQSQVAVGNGMAVFTDMADGSGTPQVWYYDLTSGATGRIWDSKFAQGSPAIWGTVVAYLEQRGDMREIWRRNIAGGEAGVVVSYPYAPSQVAVGDRLIAWRNESERSAPRVWVLDEQNNQFVPVGGAEQQSSPAAAERQVVLLRDTDKSVWRYDADTKELTLIFEGPAATPEIDSEHIVFVDESATGGDLAVVTLEGERLATLELPGEQARPRVSGKWVAFQDLGTGTGRLAIWNWTTGEVVYPAPENTPQSASGFDYPWVAYVDTRGDQGDVYAQKLLLEDLIVGTASCDDEAVVPLAVLTVTVDPYGTSKQKCWPEWPSNDPCDPDHPQILEATGQAVFQVDEATRVLFCIDSDGVQAGTISMNGAQLVGSDELHSAIDHVEARTEAQQGDNSIETWIEGYCATTLTVRVLADPGPETATFKGADLADTGRQAVGPGCGCGSGGSSGIWVLAGLALLWARRVRAT